MKAKEQAGFDSNREFEFDSESAEKPLKDHK